MIRPPGHTVRHTVEALCRALAFAALVIGVVAGCRSDPPAQPRPEAASQEPTASFPRRSAEAPQVSPEHEPFVRLVDTARLEVGMTKEEVLEVFPDPDRIEISPRGREVWKYDFAQLHFLDNRLEDWFNTPGGL